MNRNADGNNIVNTAKTKKLLYEGKAKQVFEHGQDQVHLEYKNSLTAFNAQKKGPLKAKGSSIEISLL